MRTIPFREVLHAVAEKFGLDPEQSNFLTNEAIPIGKSIDQWVRRTYDSKDFPEWTQTHQFAPDGNHMIPWNDAIALDVVGPPSTIGIKVNIGRPLNVFLIDPRTTDAPVETDFTLRSDGIHVGFDHGSSVWIKYMEPAPRFTAEQWRADRTYAKDDIAYSYTTGEVYKSKVGGNIGHDPAGTSQPPSTSEITQPPTPIPVTTDQEYAADTGSAGQTKIMRIKLQTTMVGIPNPPAASASFWVEVMDSDYTIITNTFAVCDGTTTLADVVTTLVNNLIGGLGAGWTVTGDTTALTITIENDSDFQLISPGGGDFPRVYLTTADPGAHLLITTQVQAYQAAVSSGSVTPQSSKITFGQNQVIPGATYRLTFIDNNGLSHIVEYVSDNFASSDKIVSGLSAAIIAGQSSDSFLTLISATPDTAAASLTLQFLTPASLDAVVIISGSPWWELVPFPLTIANAVIRGAFADLEKEWSQTDKAALEEQAVPGEAQIATDKFQSMPNPELTNQQRPMSRYKI